jgi:hypothetical protein
MAPRPTMDRYQLGHGRNGGRGGTRGRSGRNNSEASSSSCAKYILLGIRMRDPNVVVQSFLSTFVPGPNSSTPAFVVPYATRPSASPFINSDVEDSTAQQSKRLKHTNRGRNLELRNENWDVEGY